MNSPGHRNSGAQARPRPRSPAPSVCRMVADTGTAAERAPGERPWTGGDRPWTQGPSPRQRRPDTGSGACGGRGQRAGVARSLRACEGRVCSALESGPLKVEPLALGSRVRRRMPRCRAAPGRAVGRCHARTSTRVHLLQNASPYSAVSRDTPEGGPFPCLAG
ncbi:hypothetical protein HispidOSU_013845 [Sigmodon hispidus]